MGKILVVGQGFKLNLRMFDGGGGGGEPPAGSEPPEGGGGTPPAGGTPSAGGGAQPFITFPDEASFMSRVGREAKKQFGDMLKGLGFEREDDLKTIITAHNTAIENGKTELEKAQEAARNADSARVAALESANNTLRTAEAKLLATSLGVKPERIDYLIQLSNIGTVEVKDGKVDATALKASMESVLSNLPELKGTTMPNVGGGGFEGSGGGAGSKPPITWEYLNKISTKEAEERMPEIEAFLSKNKR